jgi:hypothetical protein
MRMVSSGILTTVRITFDKEKRGQATLFSGILTTVRITLDKEKRGQATLFSGILIDIRIPFDKEKRECVWHSQVFSSALEYPSIKRNEDVYGILRYSHT